MLALPTKSHCGISISLILLCSSHQVGMENVFKTSLNWLFLQFQRFRFSLWITAFCTTHKPHSLFRVLNHMNWVVRPKKSKNHHLVIHQLYHNIHQLSSKQQICTHYYSPRVLLIYKWIWKKLMFSKKKRNGNFVLKLITRIHPLFAAKY